ncbi:MAG: hypothetical protein HYV27_06530 [Candidatus Hydrogenedentes bacterium]|nr:hypothetical protein [Candidatus Hydrogenedentota bacterium]
MNYFAKRRILALSVVILAVFATVTIDRIFGVNLYRRHLITGWFFLALMIALALYNARKKFPVPPLISSRAWLQFHLYAGVFTLAPYLLHAGFQFPTGILETLLAALYFAVVITGIAGIFISRIFPRRMTVRGGEVVFERLPEHRRRIQLAVEALAESSVEETQSLTLITFYTDHLRAYFEGPRHFFYHLFEFSGPVNRLQRKIEEQYRYLNDKERRILTEIGEHVRRKDTLDYHHALQFTLKAWLFIHIPLTYVLLLLVLVHVWLAHAFSGRAL